MLRGAATLLTVALLAGCQSLPLRQAPSANHDDRIAYLVLHFTSEDHATSVALLTQSSAAPVSAHYLVPSPEDPTRPPGRLEILALVPESRRAWHAGVSGWSGETALNGRSIGIELVNRSACAPPAPGVAITHPVQQRCRFEPWPREQIELLARLLEDVLARHPDIDPIDIVGHADIAPARRVDPGPLFPWRALHARGIGAWPDPDTTARWRRAIGDGPVPLRRARLGLALVGYGIDTGPRDGADLRFALRAFQMHWHPEITDGRLDGETLARIYALIEQHRGRDLRALLSGTHPRLSVAERDRLWIEEALASAPASGPASAPAP